MSPGASAFQPVQWAENGFPVVILYLQAYMGSQEAEFLESFEEWEE